MDEKQYLELVESPLKEQLENALSLKVTFKDSIVHDYALGIAMLYAYVIILHEWVNEKVNGDGSCILGWEGGGGRRELQKKKKKRYLIVRNPIVTGIICLPPNLYNL